MRNSVISAGLRPGGGVPGPAIDGSLPGPFGLVQAANGIVDEGSARGHSLVIKSTFDEMDRVGSVASGIAYFQPARSLANFLNSAPCSLASKVFDVDILNRTVFFRHGSFAVGVGHEKPPCQRLLSAFASLTGLFKSILKT
jgi:hypothetical protein